MLLWSTLSVRYALNAALFTFSVISVSACSSSNSASPAPLDAGVDAIAEDATPPESSDGGEDASKSAACATDFGTALTAPYGRLDGTVLAVLEPANPVCPRPNSTHLILQVTMGGAPYRMVLNVQSDRDGVDPKVRFQALDAPLAAPAWSEGWHQGAALDYVTTLGVHSAGGFTPMAMNELVAKVTDAISLGSKVSVYASTRGGDSAHLIHRNATNADGAIVVGADGTSPTWLLFHFEQQTF